MTLVDTNILVYATVPGCPEHAEARGLLAGKAGDHRIFHVTWVNLFEYLRVVTHPRFVRPAPLPMPAALENVQARLARPEVTRIDPGPRHLEVFEAVCREAGPVSGNFVNDCRIAAIMRENRVSRILTRDTTFRRIPGIEVVDPFE